MGSGKFEDLTNEVFDRLKVIKRAGNKGHNTVWLCECFCGNLKEVRGDSLKSGETISCGCFRRECVSKRRTGEYKHNLSKTRIYKIWHGMIERCSNSKHFKYHDYGARGIKVCDEWANDFMNFYIWSKEHGYSEELTIERVDNNGNYEPSNCAWRSRVQQNFNKRNTHNITIGGVTKPMTVWAKDHGISSQAMYHRVKNGWSGVDLLKPINEKQSHKGKLTHKKKG